MLKRERQAFILHQINLRNRVLSADLSHNINVSDDTIRRDLHELAQAGKLIKVHGGALSTSFHSSPSANPNIYSYAQKRIIGQKAASLIRDGMFVITGGGTTVLEMIRALPQQLQATFITGSVPAIFEYMNHPTIDAIFIGGKVSKHSKITVGPEAVSRIREIRADLCFLGLNAINAENGVSDNDWEVVHMKKAMIESSQRLVCLTIAEKISAQQPIQVCAPAMIDTLITERSPDEALLQPYKQAGIQVL